MNKQLPVEALVPRNIATEFGLAVDPRAATMGGPDGTPNVPPIQPYVFELERFRALMVFWDHGFKALKLRGDPAAGKSSLVEQFHARLRWPLYMVSCSQHTEPHHLYGQFLPQADGTLRWQDGPVIMAARKGASVLLDEFNTLDPNCSTSLNLLLEGYSITIPETGEVITPAPTFRVFATENGVNSRLQVAGRNVQDVANSDRWMVIEVGYIDPQSEAKIIRNDLELAGMPADKAETTAKLLVATATKIRQLYRESDPKVHNPIEKPMSTRVLKRWAKLSWGFRKMEERGISPLLYSLPMAFDATTPGEAACVLSVFKEVSGVGA